MSTVTILRLKIFAEKIFVLFKSAVFLSRENLWSLFSFYFWKKFNFFAFNNFGFWSKVFLNGGNIFSGRIDKAASMCPQEHVCWKKLSQKCYLHLLTVLSFWNGKSGIFAKFFPQVVETATRMSIGTISVVTIVIIVFNFWIISDSNWKKSFGSVTKIAFDVSRWSIRVKLYFMVFSVLFFFRLWAERFVLWDRKKFRWLSKIVCSFLWETCDVYFSKFEKRLFFLAHFFQNLMQVFRSPGFTFPAVLTKLHSI